MRFIIVLLLLFSFTSYTQGLLFDDERYHQLPTQSQYNDGSKSEEKALEGVKKYSLKAYCPKVQDQGELATCVGWSVGYAALSIQHAVNNDWQGQTDLITKYAFSCYYLFNQIKMGEGSCGGGAFVDSAMILLQQKGNLTALEFNQNLENCSRLPTAEEAQKARQNSIVDYMTLFKRDAPQRIKINKVKLSLLENKPVILGLMTPRSFVSPKMKGAAIWQPKATERGFFGHALTVVGFDDAKEAFEVMNSWGEDWGDKGFAWIRYNDFAKYGYYAFQMSIDETKKREKIYTGKFSLRRFLALDQNEMPVFEEVRLKLNTRNKHYKINRKEESIARGKVFQLLVSQMNGGIYLYAFGIESNGAIKHYFPMNQESPKITVPEVELFIPEPDSGLQFNKKGKEYVILLYATRPIANFKKRLTKIQEIKGNLLNRIYTLFGEELLPVDKIGFSKFEMQFENSLSRPVESSMIPHGNLDKIPQDYIIPLVLEVNVR